MNYIVGENYYEGAVRECCVQTPLLSRGIHSVMLFCQYILSAHYGLTALYPKRDVNK